MVLGLRSADGMGRMNYWTPPWSKSKGAGGLEGDAAVVCGGMVRSDQKEWKREVGVTYILEQVLYKPPAGRLPNK